MPQGKTYQEFLPNTLVANLSFWKRSPKLYSKKHTVRFNRKDRDMLVLMMYAFSLTSPPYDWNLWIYNGNVFSIKKFITMLEK